MTVYSGCLNLNATKRKQDAPGSLGTPQSAEQEISILFQAAAVKLDGIDAHAKGQKITVVQDLARELEGKIPTDTIAIEIIHQLRGKVSERLVHDCLEEKYKRKHLVDNARKQKCRKQIPSTKLAALVPLEPRQIMVDSAGNETESIATRDTNQESMDHERGKGSKKCSNCDLLEQKCEHLRLKLVEYEDVVRTQTLIRTAEETIYRSTDGCLEFQFSIPFELLRLRMVNSFNLNKSVDRVWFTGKLNSETAKVVNIQVQNITAMGEGQFDDTSNDTTCH